MARTRRPQGLPRSVRTATGLLSLLGWLAAIGAALALVVTVYDAFPPSGGTTAGHLAGTSVPTAAGTFALLGTYALACDRAERGLLQRSRRWSVAALGLFALVTVPGLHDAVVGPGRTGTLLLMVAGGAGILALQLPSARAWFGGQREVRTRSA